MGDVPGLQGYIERAQEQFCIAVETLHDIVGWDKIATSPEVSLYSRPSETGLDATKV